MQDDDFSLFKSEMRGVKRISVDRADTGKPRNDRQQLKQRQLNASVRNDEIRVDGLSDQFVIDVGPEDELSWARDGVQEGQLRKLKQGLVPFDGSLDLHGMSVVKSHVNTWLRQHPQVLGFTSCLPRHGGTGSVYVMLRRTMLEGRDE